MSRSSRWRCWWCFCGSCSISASTLAVGLSAGVGAIAGTSLCGVTMLACIKADELRTIYRQRRLNGGENRNKRYRLEGEAAGVNDAVIETKKNINELHQR